MNASRILLLGRAGQLGQVLERVLVPLGPVIAHDRQSCDLAAPEQLRGVIRAVKPRVIVNAAAYTAVDRAESEREQAFAVNAEAPRIIAQEAKARGALLIHYSTDYVFDGAKDGFYREDDAPHPLNVYGESKLAGERAISEIAGAHLIFRTSWVYGLHGRNFPKAILARATADDTLRVVADQVGAPTSVDLIADITAHCLAAWFAAPADVPRYRAIYHLAPAGETTWHGFACELVRLALAAGMPLKVTPGRIAAIATSDYPTAARRPANSRLATEKLATTFGVRLPPWQLHVERFITAMKAEGQ